MRDDQYLDTNSLKYSHFTAFTNYKNKWGKWGVDARLSYDVFKEYVHIRPQLDLNGIKKKKFLIKFKMNHWTGLINDLLFPRQNYRREIFMNKGMQIAIDGPAASG